MTFSYDGEEIKLLSEQRVTMIVPASHPVDEIESRSGFSVVVRDQNGNPIYRRVLENPMRHNVEVFSLGPGQSIRRAPLDRPKGTFVVLVPDLPNAQNIEFLGHPLRPDAHLEPTRLLARFILKPIGNTQ
jgi:hypothetical protein